MSSLTWPDHLLSLEEWEQLPEDDSQRFELVDGLLQMVPSPTVAHQDVIAALLNGVRAAVRPQGLNAVAGVDVVLSHRPALVRRPDLVVFAPPGAAPGHLAPTDIRLAVEVVSPGSARIDRVAKMAEYAEVGIPNYWISDLGEWISLDVFTLHDGLYQLVTTATGGRVDIEAPARMTIDLDDLR